MPYPRAVFAMTLALCQSVLPVALSAPKPTPAVEWVVDLSATSEETYTLLMRLILESDGTVTGDFYNSTIEAGRWQTARGRTCVSFRTTDGVGPYHSAACFVGNGVQGQTWAECRIFLFNWSAPRPSPAVLGAQ